MALNWNGSWTRKDGCEARKQGDGDGCLGRIEESAPYSCHWRNRPDRLRTGVGPARKILRGLSSCQDKYFLFDGGPATGLR